MKSGSSLIVVHNHKYCIYTLVLVSGRYLLAVLYQYSVGTPVAVWKSRSCRQQRPECVIVLPRVAQQGRGANLVPESW